MKFLSNNNKGYVLGTILVVGFILLSSGYYLYDQLVFSSKMTTRSIFKTQLDLHNISIADTVQTILNVVVPNKEGHSVSLFAKGYSIYNAVQAVNWDISLSGIKDFVFDHFIVANDDLFPSYIKKVYKRDKNIEIKTKAGVTKITGLVFEFNYCNFINTKIYDSVFSKSSLLKEDACDEKDSIKSEVLVSFFNEGVFLTVTSTLPSYDPYKGMSSSSSFSVKFPPRSTMCEEYITVNNTTNSLTFRSDVDYVTLPGLNIDGYVPYKFLISRYSLTSESLGNNKYKGSFTVYTHRLRAGRFSSYMFKSAKPNEDGYHEIYRVIPRSMEWIFWNNPMEYQNCNNVYPILGGTAPAKNCGPDNSVIASSLNGGSGWTDVHKFDIVYTGGNNPVCSITRTTTSGIVPGVRHGGCFDENTVVEDRFGEQIKIKDLPMGHALKNPVTNEIVRVFKTVAGPESNDLIEIVTEDHSSILVTQDHPIKTQRGLVRVDQLVYDDLLFNEKGSIKILSIKKIPSNHRKVYNLMVAPDKNKHSDDDHYILANGIISGDLYLQNKLKYKKSLAIK